MTVQWVHDDAIEINGTAGYLHAIAQQFRQNEVAVPHAFVIEDGVFRRLLEETGIQQRLEELLSQQSDVQQISSRIQQLLMNASFSPADRNALIQAYQQIGMADEVRRAGGEALELVSGREQQPVTLVANDPMLDITPKQWNARGQTGFLEAVLSMYASFFSPAMLLAFRNTQLERDCSIVVQTFSVPDQYCVVYTQDPRDNAEALLVESAYGLPHVFDSDQVDLHVVDKETGEIAEEHIATKHIQYTIDALHGTIQPEAVPSERQEDSSMHMQLLSRALHLALKIESLCGIAVRAELAVEKEQFTLVDIAPVRSVRTPERRHIDSEQVGYGVGAAYGTTDGYLVTWDEYGRVTASESIVHISRPPYDGYAALLTANGIVCEHGSLSGTLAQMAREVQVPCIIKSTVNQIRSDQTLTLDTFVGRLLQSPSSSVLHPDSQQEFISSVSHPITGTTILVTEPQEMHYADGCLIRNLVDDTSLTGLRNFYVPSCIWLYETAVSSMTNSNLPVLDTSNTSSHTAEHSNGAVISDFATLVECEDRIGSYSYIAVEFAALLNDTQQHDTAAVIKAIRRIRNATKATVCVVLDKTVSPENIERCLYAGADAFAVAPSALSSAIYWIAKKEQQLLLRSAIVIQERQRRQSDTW